MEYLYSYSDAMVHLNDWIFACQSCGLHDVVVSQWRFITFAMKQNTASGIACGRHLLAMNSRLHFHLGGGGGGGDEGDGWECVGFCGGFKKNVMSTWRTCTLQSAVQLTSVEHHISLIILLIYKNRPRTCVCVWVKGGE